MRSRSIDGFIRPLAAAALAALLLPACAQESPEDRVARQRARYNAKLNGFIVQAEPVEEIALSEEEVGEIGAPEEAAPEGEAPEGEAMEEAPPPDLDSDVMLDILIRNDGDERLPGLTLDISMAGADGEPKGSWKLWVETGGIAKANFKQFTHVLEDVPYEEGDGFHVEVRHPVPAAERGEYREFAVQ